MVRAQRPITCRALRQETDPSSLFHPRHPARVAALLLLFVVVVVVVGRRGRRFAARLYVLALPNHGVPRYGAIHITSCLRS